MYFVDLMYFPNKKNMNTLSEDQSGMALTNEGECGICFSNIDDHKLPTIICENNKCNQYFHESCLSNWLYLKTNENEKSDFVEGPCPNCEQVDKGNMN